MDHKDTPRVNDTPHSIEFYSTDGLSLVVHMTGRTPRITYRSARCPDRVVAHARARVAKYAQGGI